MSKVYYLASPYTHEDPAVVEERVHLACRAAVDLFRQGRFVFCPIIHCHMVARHGLPTDWEFWAEYARAMLARCDELLVLRLEGWEKSDGVAHEIALAKGMGKPIRYI